MKNKNTFLIYILVLGVTVYTVDFYTLKILSGIRAYINGESEYSKGQKDGLLYLFAYLQTEDTTYWHSFNKAIHIPMSDNKARISMINGESPVVAKKYFEQANNNPHDLNDMVWLFNNFRSKPIINKAVAIWISADTLINELYSAGNDIHINIKQLSDQEKQIKIRRITYLSSELSKKESYFSNVLSDAARKIKASILIINVFLGILFLVIIIVYAGSSIKRLKTSEANLLHSVDIIGYQNQRLLNFAYIISHNIKSYAANILSAIYLYEESETETEKTELIQDLKKSSLRFNETVENLEKLVTMQTNTNVEKGPINIGHYIDKCLDIISDDIAAANAIVHNSVPANITIDYNPAYMESILLNLLTNTLKYKQPGRDPEIHISVAGTGKELVLTIKDNGVGIDLVRHGSKLFGIYNTFHGNPDARGIGLFITKYQVGAMGGSVSVESQVGTGTSFSIRFHSSKK